MGLGEVCEGLRCSQDQEKTKAEKRMTGGEYGQMFK